MGIKKGMPNGTARVYINSVLFSETNYNEGVHHGKESRFYKNGRPELVRYFRNGMLDGLLTAYTEEGVVLHDVIFREGKAISGYITYGDKRNILTQNELTEFEEVYYRQY